LGFFLHLITCIDVIPTPDDLPSLEFHQFGAPVESDCEITDRHELSDRFIYRRETRGALLFYTVSANDWRLIYLSIGGEYQLVISVKCRRLPFIFGAPDQRLPSEFIARF